MLLEGNLLSVARMWAKLRDEEGGKEKEIDSSFLEVRCKQR